MELVRVAAAVSRRPDTAAPTEPGSRTAEAIRAAHVARTIAELTEADRACPGADAVASTGGPFAQVALVKGNRGPAEESGGAAMSGEDGEALDKALEALGFDPARSFRTLSRPEPGLDPESCAQRLRLQLEAVDPEVVLALDEEAADDVSRAFGIAALVIGKPTRALGRTLLAVRGFEASLHDDARKRRVWAELKTIARS
ncbi:MAG: hypothetical protein HY876_07125 [Coriobacteriales bacterium]|nr:hypothetical protein [Coriobacteriales bacterium]